jgi:hypothetical protein
LGRLTSPSGACVEHAFTGLRIQQRSDQLRTLLLNRKGAFGVSGQGAKVSCAAYP